MKLNSYQQFAQLCESIIVEASSSIDLFKGIAGGDQVIHKLHKDYGLSHDQSYTQVPKISWSELKDNYRGSWVLMKCATGTAAIKYSGRDYEAIASNGGEAQTFRDDRGGNILDFFKGIVGKPSKIYVGKETGSRSDKKQARSELSRTPAAGQATPDTLLVKFKPLWLKAVELAKADIKGVVANMIKNDAFEKAGRKIELLQKLDDTTLSIEAGNTNASEILEKAINSAVVLAAGHYYPDQTGNIERSSYRRGLSPASREGMNLLLKDISNGDQKKLGTVLGFFKRSLLAS